VIQLTQVEADNTFKLIPRNEILLDFIFPQNPDTSAISFDEIVPGDTLKVEVNAKPGDGGRLDYRALRFYRRTKK